MGNDCANTGAEIRTVVILAFVLLGHVSIRMVEHVSVSRAVSVPFFPGIRVKSLLG